MSAPVAVLSETLSGAIAGRQVVAAVFTTFTFDPEFFELQVLPILFDEEFSQVDKVRRVQLEECLRSVEEVAVYYDRRGLVGDARSASLDFRRIDARRRHGIFHPKVVLVLVENSTENEAEKPTRSLVVATLSANLTRSGWWENLEAGHVEVIDPPRKVRDACPFRRDLLQLLRSVQGSCGAGEDHIALERIREFLRREAPSRDRMHNRDGGRLHTRIFVGQEPLAEWLRGLRLQRGEWNLEVLSPYFDAHGAKALAALVEAVEPRAVRVLLPEEQDRSACVTAGQYEEIAEFGEWSRLEGGIASSGRSATGESLPRRVHAKVYRFWHRDVGEVVLVGSANLTHAAHGRAAAGNLEASFLVDISDQAGAKTWWLKPLEREPSVFREEAPAEDGEAERVVVDLSIRYDWSRGELELRVEDEHEGELRLRTLAGEELASFRDLASGGWIPCVREAAERVRELLASTSFLEAWVERGAWRVLVREEGMTHKPSVLSTLTPEEILQYWSLLSPAQRQAFLLQRLEANESLEGLRIRADRLGRTETLFDRFAGIYHAFEHLAAWAEERLDEGREKAAVTRLFGAAYDSLPVLLQKTLEREDGDPVLRYVTFLCARQLCGRIAHGWPEFWSGNEAYASALKKVLEHLDQLRAALDLDEDDREGFLDWYEEAFLRHASERRGDPA